MDANRAELILKERARKLASETEKDLAGDDTIQVLEFLMAGEHYGLETCHISEVCRVDGLVEIPCTPAFVFGVVNLHGQIVSIIDLRVFFDLPPEGLSAMSHSVVIEAGGITFGVLTDDIRGIVDVPLSSLQSALPTFTDKRKDYLKGITPEGMAILNARTILTDPSVIVEDGGTSH